LAGAAAVRGTGAIARRQLQALAALRCQGEQVECLRGASRPHGMTPWLMRVFGVVEGGDGLLRRPL